MTKVLPILLLIYSQTAIAYDSNLDKYLHGAAGALIGGVTYKSICKLTHEPSLGTLWGMGISVAVGVAKEGVDSRTHEPEINDVIYTAVGGLAGIAIAASLGKCR